MPPTHRDHGDALESDPNELLAPKVAAALIGVSRQTLAAYVRQGLLSARVLPSGFKRYRRGDVERLLQPVEAEESPRSRREMDAETERAFADLKRMGVG